MKRLSATLVPLCFVAGVVLIAYGTGAFMVLGVLALLGAVAAFCSWRLWAALDEKET